MGERFYMHERPIPEAESWPSEKPKEGHEFYYSGSVRYIDSPSQEYGFTSTDVLSENQVKLRLKNQFSEKMPKNQIKVYLHTPTERPIETLTSPTGGNVEQGELFLK